MAHKIKISEDTAKAIFLLFDLDESGEIEPQEMSMFDRRVLATPKEVKSKEDVQFIIKKQLK